MNLNHAFGFLLVGTVFGLLPRFAPGWCPANGVDGTSAREIWLQLMSTVMIGVAVGHLVQRTLSVAASVLEFGTNRAGTPEFEHETLPQLAIEVAPVARAMLAAGRREGRLVPVPAAAFRSGLLVEQQRAA